MGQWSERYYGTLLHAKVSGRYPIGGPKVIDEEAQEEAVLAIGQCRSLLELTAAISE